MPPTAPARVFDGTMRIEVIFVLDGSPPDYQRAILYVDNVALLYFKSESRETTVLQGPECGPLVFRFALSVLRQIEIHWGIVNYGEVPMPALTPRRRTTSSVPE